VKATLSDDTVYGALCDIEARYPATIAVVYADRRWSYQALLLEVNRLAAAFLASDVKPGDRIAMLCSTRIEFWTTYLAVSAIGAIWVGLGVRNKLEELAYVVGDAEPCMLIACADFEGRAYDSELSALRALTPALREIVILERQCAHATAWHDFLARAGRSSDSAVLAAAVRVSPQDASLMVYTSGTTGRPKGALLSHHGLISGSRAQLERDHGPHPVMINSFPINHIACVGDTSLAIMVAAGTTVLTERFNPREQLELIERERVTIWGGIPAMVQMTLAVPDFEQFDLSSLRVVGWGGGALPRDIIERLQRLAPRAGAVYGLTESTCNVTWTDANASMEVLVFTIGKPGSAFPCRILSDTDQVCRVGEVGEIQFKASTNMLGYWRREAATREAFTHDGWLRTGDLGIWREDGNLTLVGRRIEMFKSGGFNVYPREVEIAFEDHPAVEFAAVVPAPDRLYNEVGHAFLMLRGNKEPSVADLVAFVRTKLANYKIPKTIEIVASLPMLDNGKVDKMQLRHRAGACALQPL
jgi:acyl-CoA synthetase (AMP-forming)/AMP-acid ligase II